MGDRILKTTVVGEAEGKCRLLRWAVYFWLYLGCLLVWQGCGAKARTARTRAPDWEDPPLAEARARAKFSPISTNRPPAIPPKVAAAKLSAPSTAVATFPSFHAPETWISLARFSQSNGWSAPVRQEIGPPLAYAVGSIHGVMLLRAGLRSAAWEGLDVRLGFAPMAVGQEIFVHRLDAEKSLFPLLSGERIVSGTQTQRVVVIDPGHGGVNAGTRSASSKLYEKDFTLDWGKRLARLLRTNGWTVWLTRTNDQDIALSNRVAFADRHNADFFLSLHFNSSPNDTAQAGLETYCLTPAGMPSSMTRGYEDDLKAIYPNNSFDAQNLLLGLQLHRQILRATGQPDRGIRHARFLGVLRNQRRPAVLIEGAYLSSPREASLVAKASFRQKLAEAVAFGLAGLAPKLPPPNDIGFSADAEAGTNGVETPGLVPGVKIPSANTNTFSPVP